MIQNRIDSIKQKHVETEGKNFKNIINNKQICGENMSEYGKKQISWWSNEIKKLVEKKKIE